ncbi:MAG TPA: thiamine pyrophosphate-dependent enzyme [Nitrososphaera sp.]|nr:thiamine pyrophosphate-dependent enzyme [Nitrososphaera sp.]
MTKDDLIAFEKEVAEAFEAKLIPGPIHLSGGNEDHLIKIFKDIKPTDWVFSTWRSHYHALLHGIPPEKVMAEVMSGRSMGLHFPEHNFFTSAIVGGILPIAVGVAYAIKQKTPKGEWSYGVSKDAEFSIMEDTKVWCFVGDMAATTGIFDECRTFAARHDLPLTFYVEDNGLSCNTPTEETWGGTRYNHNVNRYAYNREVPHCGTGKWVTF